MDDGASRRSLTEEVRELRAMVEEWQARADRQARIDAIVDGAARPRPHRHRRDRHGLRLIRGGLPALVPLAMPGHGAAAALLPAWHVWLSARAWPRWAAAVLALGLAGATAVPTAADTARPQVAVARVHRHRVAAEEDAAAALANLLCGRGVTAPGGARSPC